MMFVPSEIEVFVNKKTKEHYRSFGYEVSNAGYITINPDHSTKGSTRKIDVKCDRCGLIQNLFTHNVFRAREKNGEDLCASCVQSVSEKAKIGHKKMYIPFEEALFELEKYDYEIVEMPKKLNYFTATSPFVVRCKKHDDTHKTSLMKIRTKKHCCRTASVKSRTEQRRLPIEEAKRRFLEKGLEPLFDDETVITTKEPKLPYVCSKHPDAGVQFRTLSALRQVNTCCPIGGIEFNRKYPITSEFNSPLKRYLRGLTSEWKKRIFSEGNNTCCLSGEVSTGNVDAHHLISFSNVLEEAFANCNVEFGNNVSVSREKLTLLSSEVKRLHLNVPGCLMRRDIHTIFHSEYGRDNNTIEQFEEFKNRFEKGEFDGRLSG